MTKSKAPVLGLLVGALGVVFGDIGTSPLYAVKVIFGQNGQRVPINQLTVYGILSLIVWTVTIVVSLKYIGWIMQADNHGEGGIMALVARIRNGRLSAGKQGAWVLLGLIGVALFYGDSAITPAISVLSAVEGVKVLPVNTSQYIVPATLIILAGLFWLQQYGTAVIGKLFGPVMLLWFAALAAGGIGQVALHPEVLRALSPASAVHFVTAMPAVSFAAMGAVVLAVTGAEALYADMGHFGRPPIARAWFFVVFPSLVLSYLGQGALVLYDSSASANPFFLMFPAYLHIPMIILAAAATLIASQAVISGAFSLSRQAIQLNFLPRSPVTQTSDQELGQIYMPVVNILLFMAVVIFVVVFGSSERLAGAYGVAVSGALLVDSLLFTAIMVPRWKGLRRLYVAVMGIFVAVDVTLVAATSQKIPHGGWLPLLVAAGMLLTIWIWTKGEGIISHERRTIEGPLQDFIEKLHKQHFKHLTRVPGQAVFIGHHPGLAPLALHDAVENMHELPEKLAVVYVVTSPEHAHVSEDERAEVDKLTYTDGISRVTLTYGFHDMPNIPHALSQLRSVSKELDFDPYKASYFISQARPVLTKRHNMPGWQKALYSLMDRNKVSSSDYYRLPIEQTTELRTLVKL